MDKLSKIKKIINTKNFYEKIINTIKFRNYELKRLKNISTDYLLDIIESDNKGYYDKILIEICCKYDIGYYLESLNFLLTKINNINEALVCVYLNDHSNTTRTRKFIEILIKSGDHNFNDLFVLSLKSKKFLSDVLFDHIDNLNDRLFEACCFNNTHVIKVLIKKGADNFIECINLMKYIGYKFSSFMTEHYCECGESECSDNHKTHYGDFKNVDFEKNFLEVNKHVYGTNGLYKKVVGSDDDEYDDYNFMVYFRHLEYQNSDNITYITNVINKNLKKCIVNICKQIENGTICYEEIKNILENIANDCFDNT